MLEWTIDAALDARRISRVLVTSPDADVEAHVRSVYGDRVSVFNRDWELALPAKPLDATLTALFDELPRNGEPSMPSRCSMSSRRSAAPAISMRPSTFSMSSTAIG